MSLRGAIIGFGEVARHGHWPAYGAKVGAEIVAVVDRSATRRAAASSLKPGLETFETVDALIAGASLDFVDICTPPSLHAEPIVAALGRGWHVLCEKPFLTDAGPFGRIEQLALASGRAVVPVVNWKYAPIIQAATSALRDGTIGRLTGVEIRTSRLKAAPTADSGVPNWRRERATAGGGILMDHGWHSMYLALHWFGEHAVDVRGVLRYPPDGGVTNGGVEDEAEVTVDFPAGTATIELTWNGSVRRNSMRLIGTLGEILIDDDVLRVNAARPYATTFAGALSGGSHHADWFASMMPDVVRGFRNPAQTRPWLAEAGECLALIQAAYRGSGVLV